MAEIPVEAAPAAAAPAATEPWRRPPRQPLSGWKVFLLTTLGVVVGLFLFFLLLFALLASLVSAVGQSLEDAQAVDANSVLEIDLRAGLADQATSQGVFGSLRPGLVDTVRALERAETDSDIRGVFIRGGLAGVAPATSEELSAALEDFKRSGKFVVAHAQGFETPGLTAYSPLAPAEIWLQATTSFSTAGMGVEADYYRGVFDQYGIDPEFTQFEEFKSAADTYDETGMTAPVRLATEAWLQSAFDALVDDVARQRGLEVASVEAALQAAPHTAEAALELGLVDRLGYYEEARRHARQLAVGESGDPEDAEFLSVGSYEAGEYTPGEGPRRGAPSVAVISGQGTVVPGEAVSSPFGGVPVFAGDTIAAAFDAVVEGARDADGDGDPDNGVRAIVFRVSTPGGSAAASDQIDAALRRAKAAGLPVVVSMGQYAASGGYYVSANADWIVAQPSTITGSIGVLGGKLAFEDLFGRVGYNVDAVSVGGPYVGAYSLDTPFTDYQAEAYASQMRDIYDDFTSVVAQGRGMAIADVLEVAKGRVWTGAQALERGLVDELGGFDEALAKARELGGIEADARVRLRLFPRTPTFEQQLEQLFGAAARAEADLATLDALLQTPEARAILRTRQDLDPEAALRAQLRARLPRLAD